MTFKKADCAKKWQKQGLKTGTNKHIKIELSAKKKNNVEKKNHKTT